MASPPNKIKRRDRPLGILSPAMRDWFMGDRDMPGEATIMTDAAIRSLWLQHAEALTAEYAADWPGTRPQIWWSYSAPAPRRKTGGSGQDAHKAMAYAPTYFYGACFQVNVDPKRPPTFQSESAYLRERDLLLPDELEQLVPEDFTDEIIRPNEFLKR
jgi:hypothetical protein